MDFIKSIVGKLADWGKYQWGLAGTVVLLITVAAVGIGLFINNADNPQEDHHDSQTSQSQMQTADTNTETETRYQETFETETLQPIIPIPPETMIPETTPPDKDPQPTINNGGADVDITDTVPDDNETEEITFGIDVSKHQGVIDWKIVAETGIDFAMIRVGYRTLIDGKIVADSNAKYNMQEATKYGIQIGVYFFSTAITEEEAREEAAWVADHIAQYSITYPVAYNCEGFTDPENRQYCLTKKQRTDIALAFLQAIAERDYTPMFYASKSELQENAQWETSRMEKQYKIWVAQYPAAAYPQTEKSDYTGKHAMWQYTANGTVPGVSGKVDLNIAYFGYIATDDPVDPSNPGEEKPDWDAQMNFKKVNETVTAKDETNLRDTPSQGEDSTVLYTLKNGELATRVGISDYGWSKLEFNGQTYYAVSSLLTTDLTPPGPVIQTQFTPVNELVTAKDVVNLRSLPSVEHEDSQVVAQLKNGEYIVRTGINTDVGWSRVDYNGKILYCISSMLITKENEDITEATE